MGNKQTRGVNMQTNKQTDFANQGDTISRQAAIDALDGNIIVTSRESAEAVMDYIRGCADRIRSLPSAQPEITDEKAIKHLQSSGWMQNHDKQMYEMGLKEQLADDSGSYDALLPSAQPCYKTDHGYMWLCPECGLTVHSDYTRCVGCGWERRTDEAD